MTILDLVSLIIAIPATIVYKMVTGKKPSGFDSTGELKKPTA